LGPGAEFDAVRALLDKWGTAAIGIGDDAALLDVPPGERLVVSTDSSVETVHFRREWLSSEEIGWRATMAALSDLAAMGAAPLGVLLALTVPRSWRSELSALASGIGEAVSKHAAPIVGGDVTDGDRLALTITVLGHTRAALARSGARAGDTLFVTGALGGPGAALHAWLTGGTPTAADRARFARPDARIKAGRWLAAHGAHAAIDLSDGLGGDVRHVAAASGVRCVLLLDAIPRVAGVSIAQALSSGEEYELLVAAPVNDAAKFSAEFAASNDGLSLTAVGRVETLAPLDARGDTSATDASGEVVAEQAGLRVALPSSARAFDHFAAPER
jgi:thiamine-monophosphate kinase